MFKLGPPLDSRGEPLAHAEPAPGTRQLPEHRYRVRITTGKIASVEQPLSAWEVSATIRGLPANTLVCGALARLTASDRESPP
jgi:hypothetical protein